MPPSHSRRKRRPIRCVSTGLMLDLKLSSSIEIFLIFQNRAGSHSNPYELAPQSPSLAPRTPRGNRRDARCTPPYPLAPGPPESFHPSIFGSAYWDFYFRSQSAAHRAPIVAAGGGRSPRDRVNRRGAGTVVLFRTPRPRSLGNA